MSVLYWEGDTGPDVRELGEEITGVLAVEKGIVVLYSNGHLVLHAKDNDKPMLLDCLPANDPVIDFSGSGGSVGDLFVTLCSGNILQVDTNVNLILRKVDGKGKVMKSKIISCRSGKDHIVVLDAVGDVWTRGLCEESELQKTDLNTFKKVEGFAHKEVIDLQAGENFCIAVLLSRDTAKEVGNESPRNSSRRKACAKLGSNRKRIQNQQQNTVIKGNQITYEDSTAEVLNKEADKIDTEEQIGINKLKKGLSEEMGCLNEVMKMFEQDFPDENSESDMKTRSSVEVSCLKPENELPDYDSKEQHVSVPTTVREFNQVRQSTDRSSKLSLCKTWTWPEARLKVGERRSIFKNGLEEIWAMKGKKEMKEIVSMGKRQGESEVWSWGCGVHGQLGHGDLLDRDEPTSLMTLHGQGVVRIMAGKHHSLAILATGQLYSWGDNSNGQANPFIDSAVIVLPKLVNLPDKISVRDVAAYDTTSLILTDLGDFHIFGSCEIKHRVIKLNDLQLRLDLQPYIAWYCGDQGIVLNVRQFNKTIPRLVCKEKTFMRKIKGILDILEEMDPLTSQLTPVEKFPWINFTQSVVDMWSLLHLAIAKSWPCLSLDEGRNTGIYSNMAVWQTVCATLSQYLCDCISEDILCKFRNNILQDKIRTLLIAEFGCSKEIIKEDCTIELLLQEIPKLMPQYLSSLMEVQIQLEEQDGWGLAATIADITSLFNKLQKMLLDAEKTKKFWKVAEPEMLTLKTPKGKMVLDSRTTPIKLGYYSYTSYWIVLLNEYFLVCDEKTKAVETYPLKIVWLKDENENNEQGFSFELSMPESKMKLTTETAKEKMTWVSEIQKYLKANADVQNTQGTRKANYTFAKSSLKNATYDGEWMQGRMHGRGKMTWRDGRVYDGEWKMGQKHGSGILQVSNARYEGKWTKDELNGECKIFYQDGDLYEGDMKNGRMEGHGVKKEGKFLGDWQKVYMGEYKNGKRHGYGVMEDTKKGEKYLGMWDSGLEYGIGAVINNDGIYYEGKFSKGVLSGSGLMVFEDGAKYTGEFLGADHFQGKGVLETPNFIISGTFEGNYSATLKLNGTITRKDPTVRNVSIKDKTRTKRKSVNSNLKWESIFSKLKSIINKYPEMEGIEKTGLLWKEILNIVEEKDAKKCNTESEDSQMYAALIPNITETGALDYNAFQNIKQFLQDIFKVDVHPITQMFQQLISCFRMSYGGVRTTSILLPSAKAELDSIVERVYSILVHLFPTLPPPHNPIWLGKLDEGEEVSGDGEMVTPRSLLYPILLPPLHQTIFMLFALKEQKSDQEYWTRVLRWNRHTDLSLLTFLEVDSGFWSKTENKLGTDENFLSAIESLQKIKMAYTIIDKLSVIIEMFDHITSVSPDQKQNWSMDTLLPVCIYVVVRAKVLQLGAELKMIEDLVDNHSIQGEHGIMFTTIYAAYSQLLREPVNFNSVASMSSWSSFG